MSFTIAFALLGLAVVGGIMSYDVATDSGFADLFRETPERVPVDPSTFTPVVLSESDYRCKELHHSSRQTPNLWCPNPNCPDYEDDLPTEEYLISDPTDDYEIV